MAACIHYYHTACSSLSSACNPQGETISCTSAKNSLLLSAHPWNSFAKFVAAELRRFDPWICGFWVWVQISRRRACSFYKLLPLVSTPTKRPICGVCIHEALEGIGAVGNRFEAHEEQIQFASTRWRGGVGHDSKSSPIIIIIIIRRRRIRKREEEWGQRKEKGGIF